MKAAVGESISAQPLLRDAAASCARMGKRK
jgi:hypothetical protein